MWMTSFFHEGLHICSILFVSLLVLCALLARQKYIAKKGTLFASIPNWCCLHILCTEMGWVLWVSCCEDIAVGVLLGCWKVVSWGWYCRVGLWWSSCCDWMSCRDVVGEVLWVSCYGVEVVGRCCETGCCGVGYCGVGCCEVVLCWLSRYAVGVV